MIRRPPKPTRTYTPFPYPTLFRSRIDVAHGGEERDERRRGADRLEEAKGQEKPRRRGRGEQERRRREQGRAADQHGTAADPVRKRAEDELADEIGRAHV